MSFTQGLSGLNAASKDLEVIGNNVANANTVGFKGSQAQFGDVFAAALSGAGTAQIGIGVKLQAVAQQFTQGNMSVTNNSLDMAINGPGFFVLDNGHGIGYSRNGQFQLDKDGYVVSSSGHKLQGYAIDATTGKPMGSPQALTVPTAVADAAATGASTGAGAKGIIAGLNLDSRTLPSTSAFNPTNPTTFGDARSTTTYDSKGVGQTTTMYFVKDSLPLNIAVGGITTSATVPPVSTVTLPAAIAGLNVGQPIVGAGFSTGTTIASLTAAVPATVPATYTAFTTSSAYTGANPNTVAVSALADVANQWKVYTTVTDPTTGASLYPFPAPATGAWVANGVLTFGSNGRYSAFAPNPNAPAVMPAGVSSGPLSTSTSISFTPQGASPETIPFDFSASTQFGAAFGLTKLTQDGFTSGQLSGFNISADGTILGRYSNGVSKPLGQVALATFPNMQGLQPLGANEWAQSSASGAPVVNAPGSGNNGVLQTSSTEDSSVDLTAELVNMITAQRNYQANAQTIKTMDAVMQTLVNLR
jgi:flagellar hook protein FlgE